MNKKQPVTHTLRNVPYATRHLSQNKEVLLDSLRSYHSTHPYSFHRLAKFMVGVSAMTLWRIINEKTEKINNSTLYHIYHFLKKQQPYSPIKKELRNGSWIRFSKYKMPRFY